MVLPIGDVNPTRRFPIVTLGLLLLNVGVFVFGQPWWSDDPCLQQAFFLEHAAVPYEVVRGEPLDAAEVAVATPPACRLRFLVFYLVVGVVATLAFVAANPTSGSTLVGASGAIAGVLGAYLVLFPRAPVTVVLPPLVFLPFPAAPPDAAPRLPGGAAPAPPAPLVTAGSGRGRAHAGQGVGVVRLGRQDVGQLVVRGRLRAATLALVAAAHAEVRVVVGRVQLERPHERAARACDPSGGEVRPAERLVQGRLPRLPLRRELQHLGSADRVPGLEPPAPLTVEVVHQVGVGVVRHVAVLRHSPSCGGGGYGSGRPEGGRSGRRGSPAQAHGTGGRQRVVDAAPFRALRYDPGVAGPPSATSAPAYDDLDRFDYARHRTASPYTVLELIGGAGGDALTAAAETYRRWRRTGVLVRDRRPALHVYEQREAGGSRAAVQRGVLAAVAVGPTPGPTAVHTHEGVDPRRVAARVARLVAVPVDVAPVLAVTTALPARARTLLASVAGTPPDTVLTDEAGTVHRLWALEDPAAVTALRADFAAVGAVLADGHHRWAAAATAAVAPRVTAGAGPRTVPRTLAYLVDAAGAPPRIMPVHRVLTMVADDVAARLAPVFALEPAPRGVDDLHAALATAPRGTVALRTRALAALVTVRDPAALRHQLPPGSSPTWRALDTAVVDHAVIPRLAVPGGALRHATDAARAVEAVDSGAAGAAILVRPVPFATVQALALRGEHMPAKTTSFRPKPRMGLLLRPLDHADDPDEAS